MEPAPVPSLTCPVACAVDDGREIAINSLLPPFSGTGLFRLICTMNHSCVPNVK